MQGRLLFLFILTSLIADATLAQSQVKIKASDGGVIGASVSISGDYALVGAPGANASGRETGAVFIFQHVDTTWVERVKLSPNDLNEFSKFGSSLSINGEFAIIGIGSKQADNNGELSGAVYIYQRQEA